jgi:methylenetetrahydrofolate reductase (NADPH)
MQLCDLIRKKKPTISFEVFPPKSDYDLSKLFSTIEELKSLNPDFVSVTYGAGGTTREKTVEIATKIKNEMHIEAVAHLTCVNSSKDEINNILGELSRNNIDNILALRGDLPLNFKDEDKIFTDFKYASELVEYIKENNKWCVIVAGYPEKHKEANSFNDDINFLKLKADKGADLIITQLFFNNDDFYRFRDAAIKNKINIPIIAGIFPILNLKTTEKITTLCNAKIPKELLERLKMSENSKEDSEKIGIEHALNQSLDLLKNGVHGLHFYSMNKSSHIKDIYQNIKI